MGKSRSEVGHTRNVVNFGKVVDILKGMKDRYNPANPLIQMANLKALNDKLKQNQKQFSKVNPVFKGLVAERIQRFKPLNRLGTRTVNAFKTFQFPEESNNHMASHAKKMRGERITPIKKADPENEETEVISSAQTSYDNRAKSFGDMVDYCEANPKYQPNELELKTESLRDFHTRLIEINEELSGVFGELLAARELRDHILYYSDDNILEVIRVIKGYLKSLEGGERVHKKVVALKFKEKTT